MLTFFSTNLWLLWLIVSLTCLVIELSSGDFYFICFSLGALVSIVFAACDAPFIAQLLSWVIASVLCLVFVRPSLVKRLHNRKERKSNADALIGRSGKVTTTIPADGYGYVQIDGDQWRSLSADGTEIPVGTIVSVVSRDSIILTVR